MQSAWRGISKVYRAAPSISGPQTQLYGIFSSFFQTRPFSMKVVVSNNNVDAVRDIHGLCFRPSRMKSHYRNVVVGNATFEKANDRRKYS